MWFEVVMGVLSGSGFRVVRRWNKWFEGVWALRLVGPYFVGLESKSAVWHPIASCDRILMGFGTSLGCVCVA